jgi:polyamine oxidase
LKDVLADAGESLKNNLQDKSFRAAFRHAADWKPKKADAHSQLAEWWSFDSEFAFTPEESSAIFTSVAENATFQYFSEDNLFVVDQRGFSKEFLIHSYSG